ncbi:prephenate dehydratase [Kyrpidia spormannii]|uniref:Prephenate dehydratase n=2 Tax=Kyrpidia spormannii TaxID=2055160 RepID=A0ACA8ZB61_9BACL|nr:MULTISPECIES: prephenate dehydratase [Kyrpidia]ATY85472.1 prephenate dehydratase [Kyrpidia spormannii]MCL6575467.1 prephenate dehydratase [Kyrpidia sp.]CAB3393671.1 Prephenate dehydratase [Kyrpidia spormannii]
MTAQTQLAFLGPSGTFTEEAARVMSGVLASDLPGEEWVACDTIADVLDLTASGATAFGVVPIENSLEGSVNITLDWLAHEGGLVIAAEAALPVSHHLLARSGVSGEQIEGIVSHPQALAQCRGYLRNHFPGVPQYAAESTAAAAERVIRDPEDLAAIGTRLAARIYGLEILDSEIQDEANNRTRFVLVAAESRWTEDQQREFCRRHGSSKTSALITLGEDHPGALYEVLACFARERVNLTRIESRPTRRGLGSYHFFVDMEGQWWDPAVIRAVEGIHETGAAVRDLGTYPVIA